MAEEVASGAKGDRPVLSSLIAALGSGDAHVEARLDRLTGSLLQFAGVVEVVGGRATGRVAGRARA